MNQYLPLALLVLVTGCSKSQEDLEALLNGDCAGSSTVKCVDARIDLTLMEIGAAMEAARQPAFRDDFIAKKGKDAYLSYVLDLQQQQFAAELLTVSGFSAFALGDEPFSPKHAKYADQDSAMEKVKEMTRSTMELTKELNQELKEVSDGAATQALLKMDASEVGQDAPGTASPTADDISAQLSTSQGSGEMTEQAEAPTGPSFDCAKAASEIEKAICSDEELAALDLRLAEVYRGLKDEPEIGPSTRSEQVTWLKSKRAACKTVDCLKAVYTERTEELETVYLYLSKPAEFR